MKILRALLALAVVGLSACAGMAPKEDRQAVFVETTTAPKATAYSRAMAYFAKNFKNANHAIQVRNEAEGQIVANGNVDCNELRQAGDTNGYNLSFTLDFQAKDNRVRMAFEDMTMLDPKGKPVPWAYNQISDKSKAEAVKPCLAPMKDGVLKAISGSTDNW
jgi:hypothetical protein